MTPPPDLALQAERTLDACRRAGLTLSTVESCTGGLAAAALTGVAGSSDVVERGFVTYSNEAKTELVGVAGALIEAAGAVSEEVARAMAEGGLRHSRADVAVAITGIAGPAGGSPGKPVGLVHIAAARRAGPTLHERHVFAGDRQAVREASALRALDLAARLAGE